MAFLSLLGRWGCGGFKTIHTARGHAASYSYPQWTGLSTLSSVSANTASCHSLFTVRVYTATITVHTTTLYLTTVTVSWQCHCHCRHPLQSGSLLAVTGYSHCLLPLWLSTSVFGISVIVSFHGDCWLLRLVVAGTLYCNCLISPCTFTISAYWHYLSVLIIGYCHYVLPLSLSMPTVCYSWHCLL